MAKQKLKIPLKGAAPAVPGTEAAPEAGVARKRKVKSARKIKAKTTAGEPEPVLQAGVLKGKRKPARRKGLGLPQRAAAKTAELVKRLGEFDGFLPAVARPKKIRPAAAAPGRLEKLEIAIGEVRAGGRASPRTRKLLASGIPKMAQKVIEEAAEAAIEAIRGDHAAFVNESVDLFYNLVALGSELGVPLAVIWAEMDRREQLLGMAEKLPKVPDA